MPSMKPGVSPAVLRTVLIAVAAAVGVIANIDGLLPPEFAHKLLLASAGLIGFVLKRPGDVEEDGVRDVVVHTLTELTTSQQVAEDVSPDVR